MALYAFNGTWNRETTDDPATTVLEDERNTNVVRFRNAYQGDHFYVNGVGTRAGVFGRFFGGAFGIGGQARLNEAMDHLRARLAVGDRDIDVVGFSRGAALALAFANRVAVDRAVRGATGEPPRIRFLGLFDVVGSFGIPINLGPVKFQTINVGYELELPRNVDYCFHAMALDERRQTFRVTRVKAAYEVWFRGAHSDIGGGNTNAGLNAIALCWMLRKAYAAGVPVRQEAVLATEAACRPESTVRWPRDLVKNSFREVAASDRVHHTVKRPCGVADYNDPPAGCGVEDAASELTAAAVVHS